MSNVLNHFEQAGADGDNPLVLGGTVKTSGEVAVPTSATFTITPGATNQALIDITLVDGEGSAIASPNLFRVWLSDAATGEGLTATTASGAVGATVGSDFVAAVAKKYLTAQATAAGAYQLGIVDTANTGFYIVIQNPFTGEISVSDQLQAADYGA